MINPQIKILHLTPHLGGGVGKVLLNLLTNTKKNLFFDHAIACLDYANQNAVKTAKYVGFSLIDNMAEKKEDLLKKIANADIILIHWWNHPLLYNFLVRESLPACRVIIWSHNSGLYPPGVYTNKILSYPDLFVFTTPVSFESKEVQNLTYKQRKKLHVVWATGGIEQAKLIKLKKHSGFNIGYIGTVDYAKLHPNFLTICAKVKIPNVKFIVCGGPSEKIIEKEAKKKGMANKFNFIGPVADITKYLSIFDIFGYPLASYHYGTCDQTLQEGMASGIVPVVLSNKMEKTMVKSGVTGIVAKNENDYIQALETLYNNKVLKCLLSQNAKKYALKYFSTDKMVQEWEEIFKEILSIPKAHKKWPINKKNKDICAAEVFLESIGEYSNNFILYNKARNEKDKNKSLIKIIKLTKTANWQAMTRGTINHYHMFFPNDQCLSKWQLLTQNETL